MHNDGAVRVHIDTGLTIGTEVDFPTFDRMLDFLGGNELSSVAIAVEH